MNPYGLCFWGHFEDTSRQQNCFASDADLELHGILEDLEEEKPPGNLNRCLSST